MVHRRTILRSALAVATGSALAGRAGSEPAAAESAPLASYDAASVAGAETLVAARVHPGALDRAPLPETVETRLSALRDRYPSLSNRSQGPARLSLALEGARVVGGGVTLPGRFEPGVVADELRGGAFTRADGPSGIDCYRSESTPSAVGVGEDAIAVGYGPGEGSPVEHVSAALDADADGAPRLSAVADSVGGTSRAAARLGATTRSAAIDRIPAETTGLASIVEQAAAFGVGVDVTDERSHVAYGVDVDPAAVSTETYWELITSSTERAEGFDLSGVEREGRTVVVSGRVPTDSLWSVHAELLGLD